MSDVTDAYVRKVYAQAPVTICEHTNRSPDYAADQFDRWLAARDARTREDALKPVRELMESATLPLSENDLMVYVDDLLTVLDALAQADGGER